MKTASHLKLSVSEQAWWHTALIPALDGQRQAALGDSEGRPLDLARSRPARALTGDPIVGGGGTRKLSMSASDFGGSLFFPFTT